MDVKNPAAMSAMGVFVSAMVVVIFAELGCLVRTSTLALRYGQPWMVFAGTLVGTAITMGVGIAAGSALRSYLPEHALRWTTGLFFLAFGLLVLFGKLEG